MLCNQLLRKCGTAARAAPDEAGALPSVQLNYIGRAGSILITLGFAVCARLRVAKAPKAMLEWRGAGGSKTRRRHTAAYVTRWATARRASRLQTEANGKGVSRILDAV